MENGKIKMENDGIAYGDNQLIVAKRLHNFPF